MNVGPRPWEAPRGFPILGLLFLAGCTGQLNPNSSSDEGGPDNPVLDLPPGAGPGDLPGEEPSEPSNPGSPDPQGPAPALGDPEDPDSQDHQALFTCTGEPATTPSRLWRLTSRQYANTYFAGNRLDSVRAGRNPLDSFQIQTHFKNYTEAGGFDEPTYDTLFVLGKDRAEYLWGRERDDACVKDDSAPSLDCYRSHFRSAFGEVRSMRPPSEEEIDAYAEMAVQVANETNKEDAYIIVHTYRMMRPASLFRAETGQGPTEGSRRRLDAWETYTSLIFAASDGQRNAAASAARERAQDGTLSDPAVAADTLRALIGNPAENAIIRRFFAEWIGYRRIPFKDERRHIHAQREAQEFANIFDRSYPDDEFLNSRSRNRRQAGFEDWLSGILESDRRVFEQLITGSESGQGEFPERGLLTQPAWLVAYSNNFDTDPILRGKFIYERLLCNSMPDIPIDVIPAVPEIEGATLRDRLIEHSSDPSCESCHRYLDGIGLGLQGYDDFGRRRSAEIVFIRETDARGRTRERAESRDMDTTAVLDGSGDQDGPFDGPEMLATKLAASHRARQCFLRQVFRFWMGRNEHPADACTLTRMDTAYQTSEGSLVEVLAALASSDAFLTRTVEEP